MAKLKRVRRVLVRRLAGDETPDFHAGRVRRRAGGGRAGRPGPVLMTGSSGRVGTLLLPHMDGVDIRTADLRDGVDLSRQRGARRAVRGCSAIVHLAGNPHPDATHKELRRPNVDAVARVFEAAVSEGVGKVVFASSAHVTGLDEPASPDTPVRPCCAYGASKAYGEALGRLYAERAGISVICLRVGWVLEEERIRALAPERRLGTVTPRDLAQIVRLALASDIGFGIYYATSGWPGSPYDIGSARAELGYRPVDGGRPS